MSNGSSTGFISLQQAIQMTTRFRQNRETVINPVYAGRNILTICGTFQKSVFEALLAKPNCTAIRLYYGMDENLQISPIVVAVDRNDRDILPANATLVGQDIGDDVIKCPPICPPASALNQ